MSNAGSIRRHDEDHGEDITAKGVHGKFPIPDRLTLVLFGKEAACLLCYWSGQLDAEPSDTVADLKGKIQESQGHSPELQKLIYAGAHILPFLCISSPILVLDMDRQGTS